MMIRGKQLGVEQSGVRHVHERRKVEEELVLCPRARKGHMPMWDGAHRQRLTLAPPPHDGHGHQW
jgi:hypothetical protein